jgi:hypothetical protein
VLGMLLIIGAGMASARLKPADKGVDQPA